MRSSIRWCLAPLYKPLVASNAVSGYPTQANHQSLVMIFITSVLSADVCLYISRAGKHRREKTSSRTQTELVPDTAADSPWALPRVTSQIITGGSYQKTYPKSDVAYGACYYCLSSQVGVCFCWEWGRSHMLLYCGVFIPPAAPKLRKPSIQVINITARYREY